MQDFLTEIQDFLCEHGWTHKTN